MARNVRATQREEAGMSLALSKDRLPVPQTLIHRQVSPTQEYEDIY